MKAQRRLTFSSILLAGVIAMAWPLSEARAEQPEPLSAAEIQRELSRHSEDIRDCYTRHARPQRGATGKVTLEIVVRASGEVGRLRVDGVKSKRFEQCVVELAKGWQFRASRHATLVQHPFVFVHGNGRAGPMVPRHARRAAR